MQEMLAAIAAGREVYAVVLRNQTLRMVPGREAKEKELLCWTAAGQRDWRRVAVVVTKRINP